MEQYDSESAEENVDIEALSDEVGNQGWIQWFCSLEGHEFLVEIDEDFIKDPFNITGLSANFSKEKFFQYQKMILSPYTPTEEDLNDENFMESNQEASDLYGLIHKRFVCTPTGLAKIYNKFLQGVFGYCPRALCDRQKTLPVGLSDNLRTSRFKVFCPKCEECYLPKFRSINIDGAFFGTSLPHIFLQHYPEAIIMPPKIYFYEPKIYGFKVHGKRGSKAFQPTQGAVKYVEDSLNGLEREQLANILKQKNRMPHSSP